MTAGSRLRLWRQILPVLALAFLLVALAGCDRSAPKSTTGTPGSTETSSGAAGSPGASPGGAWFEEVAQQRGLKFNHVSGHKDKHYMPEIMCGGAALFDMDNDGDLDAYLVQGGDILKAPADQPGNQLFRNRGDGTFEDITAGSGAEARGYGNGVACGDFDNDGDVDLYITNVGPNILLRNDGPAGATHKFTDVTAAAGVGYSRWGASAAFFDYDNDGWLDLYVTNYLNWSPATELACYNNAGGPDYCSPQNYNAQAVDVLYHNNGNGTFTDVTEAAGITANFGTGLGVACGDFDHNGWLDIFVANDGMPNQLWVNRQGKFVDAAVLSGCAIDQEGKAKAGMGVAVADIDDDGDLDVVVCNLNRESDSCYRNDGGFFSDVTITAGLGSVSRPFTRFGMGLIDFDNDGYLDLYQANGRVMRQALTYSADAFAEPSILWRGSAGGKFKEVLPRGGTATLLAATSRAAAFGDIDNDGAVDILVVNRDGPAFLLHNIAPNSGKWIGFRVIDEHNRDALNATVSLKIGQRTVNRDVRAAYSYQASNDPRVHFGLGTQDSVPEVTVRWLDGKTEQFGPFQAGGYQTLKKGAGRAGQ